MIRRTSRIPSQHVVGFILHRESNGCRGHPALLGVLLAALLHSADAQEIPRPSAARQKVKTSLPTVSNFRVGEILMRVDAGLTTEFTDNVNLTPEGQADVIITPTVGLNVTWAATRLNTLRFRTSLGYGYYVNSPNLNRSLLTIAPDSALNFDIYSGDFRINFHDQFSLQQDPTTQGSVSGVAQLGRFTNIIGVSILWDTNDIIWSLGYDHYNLIATGSSSTDDSDTSSFNNLDHSTDQVSASASFRISSAVIGGIEVTASASKYPEQPQSDYSSFSAGAFFEMQLTRYTHLNVAGGYKSFTARGTDPDLTSATSTADFQPAGGDPSGFYANVSVVHRLNRFYSDSLNFGHSEDVDPYSGLAKANFIRYTGNWRMNEKISLATGLFYEDVEQAGSGSLTGIFVANYRRVGFTISTAYQLTEHASVSLGYQFVRKASDEELQNYAQNRATISIGYRF